MRYLLGSSYFDGGDERRRAFSKLWHLNQIKTDLVNPAPTRTVIIAEGGSLPTFTGPTSDTVYLTGDLGHIGAHLNGSKPYEFTGWSASMCALAMMAYIDVADFIYRESDCLAFGPWVHQMYKDLGDGKFIFGPKQTSAPWMSCSQSLFLVKHDFIPAFVRAYLSLGKDASTLGEDKFVKMDQMMPGTARHLTFGYDRMRPIQWEDPVFYMQQCSDADINEARSRGLI